MLKKINLKLVGFIGVQRDEETRERRGREEKGKEKGGGKGKRRRERKKNQNFPPLFLAWRNNKIKDLFVNSRSTPNPFYIFFR